MATNSESQHSVLAAGENGSSFIALMLKLSVDMAQVLNDGRAPSKK